jgi:hypothetical protein
VVLRLKSHFPAPLLGLAIGVSAVAILAAIFAFQPPSPPPDRCPRAVGEAVALEQFRGDPSAHVTKPLLYPDGDMDVIVHTDASDRPYTVHLACDAGLWRLDGPVEWR